MSNFDGSKAVSAEELAAAVSRMERAGYDFGQSPKARVALREYLAGLSLVISGATGTGKTYFFECLTRAGLAGAWGFRAFSLAEHGSDCLSDVLEAVRGLADCEVLVDDAGCESEWAGRRDDDMLERIVAVREGSAKRTHYTTNLTADQLRERYDGRLVSRLRLCRVVRFVGGDARKVAANAEAVRRRQACADPAAWLLCAERCPLFVGGRCTRGVRVPPGLAEEGGSPESVCWVGRGRIPYRSEHIEAEEALRAKRREGYARLGLALPDSLKGGPSAKGGAS